MSLYTGLFSRDLHDDHRYTAIEAMCVQAHRLSRERPVATVIEARVLASQNYVVHVDRRGRRWRKAA